MSIANELLTLNDTKLAIKQAIINKGIDVGEEDTFASYANKIGQIPSGGGVEFNEIGVCTNTDGASAIFISSTGWYRQTLSYGAFLRVGTPNGMSLYGHTNLEIQLKFKITSLTNAYLLGNGSSLCMDSISINSNGTVSINTGRNNYTTTATLQVDTEYILLYEVDITNHSTHYKITSGGIIIEENTVAGGNYDNRVTNMIIGGTNGGNYLLIGEIYLPESYVKIDNTLIWGTESTE